MKRLSAYQKNWPLAFEKEALLLKYALAVGLSDIYHIGSTSVPGMVAKPVIDILVEADDLDLIDDRQEKMTKRGYKSLGEYGIKGRRYFKKAFHKEDGVGYHIHLFQRGASSIRRHLAFRDLLIDYPNVAEEYAEIKRSLANTNGVLVPDYQSRKSSWIEQVTDLALEKRD